MSNNEVRLAQIEDYEALIGLCKAVHTEIGLFNFSERKVRGLLDRAFNREGSIIGVIGEVGSPLACIYLALEQIYYSEDWHISELWNFVHPEHRRSDYAKQLLEFAKRCGEAMALPVIVGIVTNNRTEAKVRLYERKLQKAGAFFIHNMESTHSPAWLSMKESANV